MSGKRTAHPTTLKRHVVDVIIAFNGHMGPPAEALIRYLTQTGQNYRVSQSPLGDEHVRSRAILGNSGYRRQLPMMGLNPPLAFVLDPMDLLFLPPSRLWIGLNPLATLRGLILRKVRRVGYVVHWSIDYSQRRFANPTLEWFYQFSDYLSSSKCDYRIELTSAAALAREEKHSCYATPLKPANIVPLGLWQSDLKCAAPPRNGEALRLCFAGSHFPRMGIDLLIESVAQLHSSGHTVTLNIAGHGPETPALRTLVDDLGLTSIVTFDGYINGEGALLDWLAAHHIACAPYVPSRDAMTNFADPGKIKTFLAAGIPFVTTDSFSTAPQLASRNCALLSEPNSQSLSRSILQLSHPETWQRVQNSIVEFRMDLVWERILPDLFQSLNELAGG